MSTRRPGHAGHFVRAVPLLAALLALPGCPDSTGVSCPTGMSACNSACITTLSDNANCGGCGNACAAGQTCAMGACAYVCTVAETPCAKGCVDLMTDFSNCGACGMACMEGFACGNGACAPSCPEGATNCAGSCVNLTTSAGNCGKCGAACPGQTTCVMGACASECEKGQMECGGVCTDVANDPMNCGACGTACPNGEVCVTGKCSENCQNAQMACPGGCANIETDNANCGNCGVVCMNGMQCVMGVCSVTCQLGEVMCTGSCTTTQTDVKNCGACGNTCGLGFACMGGVCSCYGGLVSCIEAGMPTCVDVTDDPANCGACSVTCKAPNSAPYCSGGKCQLGMCVKPYLDCNNDPSDGCEVDPLTDLSNCGGCGDVCQTQLANEGAYCLQGACAARCQPGFSDCDQNVVNGCEAALGSDVKNCGACGNVCPQFATCVNGACACPKPTIACPNGNELACTDTRYDSNNCGGCGVKCGNAVCNASACVVPPCGLQQQAAVPGGTFLMGALDLGGSQVPVHPVTVAPFCIDLFEVTLAKYGACAKCPGVAGYVQGDPVQGFCNVHSQLNNILPSDPINCVTWDQANAYCAMQGAGWALPTEAQWEYAARFTDGRDYPWGFVPAPGNQVCWQGNNAIGTCPVGSYGAGKSALGLFDMAGNVTEWVQDWFAPYPMPNGTPLVNPVVSMQANSPNHVLRGGAWMGNGMNDNPMYFRTEFRDGSPQGTISNRIGFRCVLNLN